MAIKRNLFGTSRGRLQNYTFKPEHILSFIKQYSLNAIFKEYAILQNEQNNICKLLMGAQLERIIELKAISQKSAYAPSERINLYRLRNDLQVLLDVTPYIKSNEKKQFMDMIDFAIKIENSRRQSLKEIKKQTGKRTIEKIKINKGHLRIYTLLIRNLTPLLNRILPNQQHRYYDRERSKTLIKENTFKLTSVIINQSFPSVNFTPEQIKARFHKTA